MTSDDDIRGVLDQQQAHLLTLPHVVGTGIVDRDDGGTGSAVALYVDTLDPAAKLPTTLDAVVRGAKVSIPVAVRLMGAMTF